MATRKMINFELINNKNIIVLLISVCEVEDIYHNPTNTCIILNMLLVTENEK